MIIDARSIALYSAAASVADSRASAPPPVLPADVRVGAPPPLAVLG